MRLEKYVEFLNIFHIWRARYIVGSFLLFFGIFIEFFKVMIRCFWKFRKTLLSMWSESLEFYYSKGYLCLVNEFLLSSLDFDLFSFFSWLSIFSSIFLREERKCIGNVFYPFEYEDRLEKVAISLYFESKLVRDIFDFFGMIKIIIKGAKLSWALQKNI